MGFDCGIFWTFSFVMGNFFGHFVLVMRNNELNFCVTEPQELRQPPNVEKCMGRIVS